MSAEVSAGAKGKAALYPPCPAANYGKSSEFGQILDFIQNIVSDEALRKEFDIPHLVVVGRQNMAKTTLINRLIGRYLLPMRKGKTATHLQALTTYPIILNLRPRDQYGVDVNVHGHPNIGGHVDDPKDDQIENFLREVAEKLPKEPGTEISKTPVTVTLFGPELSTLTLVDLPGVHFANDNNRMNIVTQSLMLDYIKKNKKSVIVIVSQVGDPTGDSAINLVMTHAHDYKNRTICVLTKPDKHNEADDIGRKVALNDSHFTLESDHFILLKGKDGADPIECEWDAETTRLKEKEWFSIHKQYSDIMHICGVDRLMDTMVKMLSEKMIEEIPNLISSMKSRKAKLESELQALNQTAVPQHDAGRGKLMSSLQSKLINQLETLLFNNTTNSPGGEKVRNRILAFNDTILQLNPLEARKDTEIIELLRRLEGVAAPLGDSSENNQLLEMLLYETFPKGLPSHTSGSVPLASPMPSHTSGSVPLASPMPSHTFGSVAQASPMPSHTFGSVALASPIDKLTGVCEELVADVEKELRTIVLTAVQQTLSVFPDLRKSVEVNVVSKIFDEKQKETMTFIKQFIQMQKKSIDVVEVSVLLPQDIDSAVKRLVDIHYAPQKIQGNVQPVLRSSGGLFGANSVQVPFSTQEPALFNQLRHLSTRLHPTELINNVTSCSLKKASYKDKEQVINTKKNVVRCFNTIKLNVINTVPRCIQHFFVTQLVESLTKELESNDLMEFLQEKDDIRRKRAKYQKTLDSINHTLPQTEQIAPMLLRIKQGRSAFKH